MFLHCVCDFLLMHFIFVFLVIRKDASHAQFRFCSWKILFVSFDNGQWFLSLAINLASAGGEVAFRRRMWPLVGKDFLQLLLHGHSHHLLNLGICCVFETASKIRISVQNHGQCPLKMWFEIISCITCGFSWLCYNLLLSELLFINIHIAAAVQQYWSDLWQWDE